MKKKAQLSLPLIIGISLVILLFITTYLTGLKNKRVLEDDAENIKSFMEIRNRVEEYVKSCISVKTMEVFDKLWVTSEKDIQTYLDDHFLECINDFSNFRDEGYYFEYFDHYETLELEGNDAIINMNFTVNISRDEQRTQVKNFLAVIELDDLDLETKGEYVVDFEDIPDFEMPFKNVAYKEELVDGLKLYIIKVNLNDPTLEFFVTPKQDYLEGTTSFLAKNKVQVAINGGGWDLSNPTGNTETDLITYSQGELVSEGPDFWVTVTITKNNSVILGKKPKDEDIYNVVTGFNLFVQNNEVTPRMFPGGPGYKEGYDTFDPRTTIGYDEEHNVLNIILVDSDIVGQRMGMRLRDIGVYHVREGSDTAINMDGGGSTTLVMEGQGILNAPSDGAERPVATHLGIWAERMDFSEEIVADS